jgi:hypothetical protein
MKVAAAFGLLALTGCVRAAEGVVRDQAASAFACADYALHVEEVGPDVYRAAGCGQELIYACHPTAPSSPQAARGGEVADVGDDAVMECERRLPAPPNAR